MKRLFSPPLRIVAVVAVVAVAAGIAAAQQPSAIKRIPLQKIDVPGADYQTVMGVAEIGPNVDIGRHTHPGIEVGYVLSGEAVLLIDGQPPKTLKAGDSYQIPANAIHTAKTGASGSKVIATYVVKKGEPLAKPAK